MAWRALAGAYWRPRRGSAGLVVASGGFALVSTGLGLRQYRRYRAEREAAAVQAYENGWGLPPDIRRRLKFKYFRAVP